MKFRIIATIVFLVILGIIVYVVDPSVFSGGTPSRGTSGTSSEF